MPCSGCLMKVFVVGKPNLPSFGSFAQGVQDATTQERTKKARQDWAFTDSLVVRAYSYSTDRVRIHFDSKSLDIYTANSTVDWTLHEDQRSLAVNEPPIEIRYADADRPAIAFDRDAVLAALIGQRIRCAPSANQVTLIWQPSSELGILSLPLLHDQGHLLIYELSQYSYPTARETT